VVVAFAVVLFLASGCGGSSQTYSVEEAKAAFARHGYVLSVEEAEAMLARRGYALETEGLPIAASLERDGQAILAPSDDSGFFVVVTTDAEADEVWPDYERLQDDDSFDVRRANIGLFTDDGVSPSGRQRILAAFEALPDRDAPVLIAGG
jgi:hypothetical protein